MMLELGSSIFDEEEESASDFFCTSEECDGDSEEDKPAGEDLIKFEELWKEDDEIERSNNENSKSSSAIVTGTENSTRKDRITIRKVASIGKLKNCIRRKRCYPFLPWRRPSMFTYEGAVWR